MDPTLEYIAVEAALMQVIGPDMAWHYRIVPRSNSDGAVSFYVDTTRLSPALADELEMTLGRPVTLEPVEASRMERTLNKYFIRKSAPAAAQTTTVVAGGASASEDFLFRLIEEARQLRSSDIHIESYADRARVRIRVDGLLLERYHLPRQEYPALINRVKILAGLDIAEKRLPQDGRIFFTGAGQKKFDIRVSVVPTLHGEKVVLRLLSNDATTIDLYKMGMREDQLQGYLEGVRRPTGMILISGPTGSGKTTTLYATLKLLNLESRNILTIEDPIEYTLEGINQVQLREDIGLDFASALRTFLRQDPDIIMVGEIRDPATAQMAVRAALTGHLVLSTIHTNSAWGTVSRLVDMGVPAYMVANTLNTSVAQRLLRLLCPHCKRVESFSPSLYPRRFKPLRSLENHYLAVGCPECHYTGYQGRQAVYEVISLDAELAESLKNHTLHVSDHLRKQGVIPLAENAFRLFEEGQTTLDEIYPLLFETF